MAGMQIDPYTLGGRWERLSVITQMFQGPFILMDVRAHVGEHKAAIFRTEPYVSVLEVLFRFLNRGQESLTTTSPFNFPLIHDGFFSITQTLECVY